MVRGRNKKISIVGLERSVTISDDIKNAITNASRKGNVLLNVSRSDKLLGTRIGYVIKNSRCIASNRKFMRDSCLNIK
jgi:hypothetical protein